MINQWIELITKFSDKPTSDQLEIWNRQSAFQSVLYASRLFKFLAIQSVANVREVHWFIARASPRFLSNLFDSIGSLSSFQTLPISTKSWISIPWLGSRTGAIPWHHHWHRNSMSWGIDGIRFISACGRRLNRLTVALTKESGVSNFEVTAWNSHLELRDLVIQLKQRQVESPALGQVGHRVLGIDLG